MHKKRGKYIKYISIVIIIFLFLNNYYNKYNSTIVVNRNYTNEIKKIEDYLKFCKNNLIKIKKRKKCEQPKISIISPIYNRGRYVKRFIKSLQNQNFDEIEIILIDDCSHDNTNLLIKQYLKEDKRIILIKNKKNKGTFASRNIGSLKSKGQFVMFPDPDDILEQNCLHYFYNLAIKNNYELIRFHIYLGKKKIFYLKHLFYLPSKAIYQPELSTYLFYAKKFVFQIDFNVSNKFINREALIRALNYISKNLFLYITRFEDGILNYLLYRASKSFYFSKKIAYYYILNRDSITKKKYKISDLKCTFWYLKFLFSFSKNTRHDKNMLNALFKRIVVRRNIYKKINRIKNDFNFYIDIIDEFLRNEFISIKNKKYLMILREKIRKKGKNNSSEGKSNISFMKTTSFFNIDLINQTNI